MMLTFKRNHDAITDNTYDVLVDGVLVGRVFPTWQAVGGNGWTYSVEGGTSGGGNFPTRALAAKRLIFKASQ